MRPAKAAHYTLMAAEYKARWGTDFLSAPAFEGPPEPLFPR